MRQKNIQISPASSGFSSLTHCPVTGLEITRHPEWTLSDPEGPYEEQFFLLGKQIIYSHPAGAVNSEIAKKSLEVNQKVEAAVLSEMYSYIQIEDLSNLDGFTINARRVYIQYLLERKHRFSGFIFVNVSLLTALGIKVAAKIYLADFPIRVVDSYKKAVECATDLLSTGAWEKTDKSDTGVRIEEKASPASELIQDGDTLEDYKYGYSSIPWHIES